MTQPPTPLPPPVEPEPSEPREPERGPREEPRSRPQAQVLAGRYRLDDLVGGGGMAWVFRGRDLRLDREVAIKILRPQYAQRPDFRQRFLEEARVAAQLNHPNLVTIFDVGEEGDRVFIVMEYVPGRTLASVIREQAPMPLEEALYLAVQACAGVGYLHRAGLVHGDLKPSNLLVLPDRRLKVTDFGLAGAIGVLHVKTDAQGRRFVWGSPRYLSPEHARGEPLLPASDVYALGLILYEMLTARSPYTATTQEEWLQAHVYQPPVPPRQWRPDLSPRLERVLLKALEKHPSRRFRTADHLGRVLLLFTESEETRAVPLPETGRSTPRPASPQPEPRVEQAPPSAPVAEPPPAPQAPPAASRPTPAPRSVPPAPRAPSPPSVAQAPGFDWLQVLDPLTLLLGVLAVLALAGLIPLWVWVYLLYR